MFERSRERGLGKYCSFMSSLIMNASPPPLPRLVGQFCATISYPLGAWVHSQGKFPGLLQPSSVVAMWWT